MLRGIGAFILFLGSYMILGSVAGAVFFYFVGTTFFPRPPAAGSLLDRLLDFSALAATGLIGVFIGHRVLSVVMKSYPARGIGAAFILWLIANYAVHFWFFPERVTFEDYGGLVQSGVACVAAWFIFGLPPLSSPQSN